MAPEKNHDWGTKRNKKNKGGLSYIGKRTYHSQRPWGLARKKKETGGESGKRKLLGRRSVVERRKCGEKKING